jgi:cytochrome c553
MTKTIRSLVVLAAVVSMAGALSFAQSGDATYKAKCQMCHGPAGTPNPTMAKMMGIKNAAEYKSVSAADMMAAVKNGKGKMKPVAGLSDAQIKDVVTYFRALK